MKVVKMSSKVTIRKDGRMQMTYFITLSDGTRKRQYVYGKTREEVKDKYTKAIVAACNGRPVLKNKLTLEQYLSEWIKDAKNINESTRANYWGEINKHIIPKIGKKRLSNLNSGNIQDMMDSLIKNGVTPRTTQILKNILSKALKNAEMRNLVKPDIMKYVELETYRPKQRKIWDKNSAQIFSEVIKHNKYYFFFLMYITYGLRRGEAIGIKWSDIDFESGVIHIQRQCTIVKGEPKICRLKTFSSIRDLPILPHIRTLLEELGKTRNSEYVLSFGGRPINPASVNYEFEQIIKKNSLPRVTLHSLRHFAATSLKNAGVTIKEAQEILGHSTPVTTMQYYQHSSIEDKRNALIKYAESMSF